MEKENQFKVQHIMDIIEHKLLDEEDVKKLCKKIMDDFYHLPNVLDIQCKELIVVGDIHGQFHDFLRIFKKLDDTKYDNLKNTYLFLGDYVDRGYFSLEVLQFLCILYLLNPTKVNLLRGNHEIRQISSVYGFNEECQKKYGVPSIYNNFMDMLDLFPLAAVVNSGKDRTFCVHGGISPTLQSIDQMYSVIRNREIPIDDELSDLLWSDPEENLPVPFQKNSRGSGHIFSAQACKDFCERNGIVRILRSHQLAMDGYKKFFDGKLWIVWSAPNYCYRENNQATILKLVDKNGGQLDEKDFINFGRAGQDGEDKPDDFYKDKNILP